MPLPSAVQTMVPLLAHSPTPLVHTPPSTNPLSTTLSQSWSSPSHNSAAGLPGTASHSVPLPSAVQTVTPACSHSPMPLVQAWFRSNPLSGSPSQSWSSPSHSSASGWPGTALHSVPLPSTVQTVRPASSHSPTPLVQASPSENPLMGFPSQSWSRLSHSSASG